MSGLLPSLQVERLQEALTDYLTTTFALTDKETREAATSFITHPTDGIYVGPYLNISLPFAQTEDNTSEVFDWYEGYPPYGHQAAAYSRLSSKINARPQPTLVTTGTGSGKTEAFLYPILDHVLRAKKEGITGTKALIIYPMNALAADQADRLTELLTTQDQLRQITAAIYTGDQDSSRTAVSRRGLINNKDIIRDKAPDILLTNYKMLDQLLLRPADAPLWKQSADSLQYLVLDEFHTYDGAQGTDVAMLLRRLGHTLNQHRTTPSPSSNPLHPVTPVATSATLGEDNPDTMRHFAETVFGQHFPPDSVIRETRQTQQEWSSKAPLDFAQQHDVDPITTRADDANILIKEHLQESTHTGENYGEAVTRAVLNTLYTPSRIGDTSDEWIKELLQPENLLDTARTHPLINSLLQVVQRAGGTIHIDELAQKLFPLPPSRRDQTTWDQEARSYLNYLLAFLSYTRQQAGRDAPSINLHLWLRELSRIDRSVTPTTHFRWKDDGTTSDNELWLPALYCRSCGRSGWGAVLTPGDNSLDLTYSNPRRATVTDDGHFRTLMNAPLEGEKQQNNPEEHLPGLMWFNSSVGSLNFTPPKTTDPELEEGNILPVICDMSADAEKHAQDQTCPCCGTKDSIRFLGSAVATQLSVNLSTLFGDENLDHNEKKALVFTDSVQDAAHRASFVQSRSHTLGFRTKLRSSIPETPTPLPDIIHNIISDATTNYDRYQLLPPDLAARKNFNNYWDPAEQKNGKVPKGTERLIEDRILFDAELEFGLFGRYGRTLEITGSATAEVDVDKYGDPAEFGQLALTHCQENNPTQQTLQNYEPNTQHLAAWVRGTVYRIRLQGGINHPYLKAFINEEGNRWRLWGGRNLSRGVPAFPAGRPTPSFPYTSGNRRKKSEFDNALSYQSWYSNWTSTCLGINRHDAPTYTRSLLHILSEKGVLNTHTTKSGATVYSLKPADILVTSTPSGQPAEVLECDTCGSIYPAGDRSLSQLDGAPCHAPDCIGTLHRAITEPNFYQDFYNSKHSQRVIAHEHTSLLDNDERKEIEDHFKNETSAANAPNVLVATPTLEMGIDIGDLSTVMLSSLPKGVANYLQRIGRAGRRDGSSLAITHVAGYGENLTKLHEPLNTIAGEVRPPATFLDAQEILQRQFIAYLLDNLAANEVNNIPKHAKDIFTLDEDSWLHKLLDDLKANTEKRIEAFLASFGDFLSEGAKKHLREWASFPADGSLSPLENYLQDAINRRTMQIERTTDELRIVKHKIDELSKEVKNTPDKSKKDQFASALATRKLLRAQLNRENVGDTWIQALERYGLLPNYTLLDDDVTLNVSISWIDDNDGDQTGIFKSDQFDYSRNKASALYELAPGSTFYAKGLSININAVDMGKNGNAVEHWQICPDCGHVEIFRPGDHCRRTHSCPTCSSPAFTDQGQSLQVVEMKSVSADISRDRSYIGDKEENRRRMRYSVAALPDLTPQNVTHTWHTNYGDLEVDFFRDTTVRWLNLGPTSRGSQQRTYGSNTYTSDLFRVCPICGHLDNITGENRFNEHRSWCPNRDSHKEFTKTIGISRTLKTQAVLLHLPKRLSWDNYAYPSLAAAIKLGLRETIGGSPEHLDVITVGDALYNPGQQALMIIDTVPGGTGYLAEFSNPEKIHAVLANARRILQKCECQNDTRNACHKCLLPFAKGPKAQYVSRVAGLKVIDILLDCGPEEETPSIELWDVEEGRRNPEELSDNDPASALEEQFHCAFLKGLQKGSNDLETSPCTVKETPSLYMPTARIITASKHEWMLTPQVDKGYTKPDFQLKLRSGQFPTINIYLDGKAFHASVGCNNIDDDAMKRQRIRLEDDELVWNITYDDLKHFTADREELNLPWLTNIDQALHNLEAPSKLQGILKKDAISQLIKLINLPDISEWQNYASRVLVHLLSRAKHAGGTLAAHVQNERTPHPIQLNKFTKDFLLTHKTPSHDRSEGEQYASWYDNTGFPGLAIGCALNAIDLRDQNKLAPTHIACTLLLDGSNDQLREDEGAAWQQWLRLANIVGLLDNTVISTLANVDSEIEPLIYRRGEKPRPMFDVAYQPLIDDALDDVEENMLKELARQGLPVPKVGAELSNGDVADLVWPDLHIISFRDEEFCDPDAHKEAWTIVPFDSETIAATIKEKTQ
ncbi:MAG: DEAD/DEAH box helicase [Lawsonella sp.]